MKGSNTVVVSSSDEVPTIKSLSTPQKRKLDEAETTSTEKQLKTTEEQPSPTELQDSEVEAGREEREGAGECSTLWRWYFPDRPCPPSTFYLPNPQRDDRCSEVQRFVEDFWPP
ncbi:hypothetical protein V5799_009049 [Amblyomma americanum]|uniref:Uncharacterized protein n=1 Tax=Amblyomma americanum TaxID=6943 RepID=A0AAQ4FD43_AMBAM